MVRALFFYMVPVLCIKIQKLNKLTPLVFLSLLTILAACSSDPYDPDKFLTDDQRESFILQSVYYSSKLPPNSSHQTKFSREFDGYYKMAADESTLLKYYKSVDGTGYYLIARKARSITPMKEGIGGKVRFDEAGKIAEYEEVFRTWKMNEDSLLVRGPMLFERMIEGKDLTQFYSKFQGDKFIEFPDDRFVFDKQARRWHDRMLDSTSLNP